MRLILAVIATALAAAAIPALPSRQHLSAERGRLLVFPGDSLDMASVTFVVDGDTVSRDSFFTLRRADIHTLTVTPAPANLVEVTTHRAAARPLDAADLPDAIVYVIDGDTVGREAFTALPPDDIAAIVTVRSCPPRIEVTTARGAAGKQL